MVNVGGGPVIEEPVFEIEPSPMDFYLRTSILGSHNASDTTDTVTRSSEIAIDKPMGFLRTAE